MRRPICNLLSFLPGKERGLTLKEECRKRKKKGRKRKKEEKEKGIENDKGEQNSLQVGIWH